MARAMKLAWRGLYGTHPNPRVGCVLVRGDEIVGEGYHRKAGGAHAERHALEVAGERARGATAYVTLEPCCHQGRTPPCTDALIAAGVSRVVAAMVDPNPLVSGNGLARLRQAGIETEAGCLEKQAEALNPGFIRRMRTGRPYVRCKLAMSLDGRTAMASGESQWITGPKAREDVHRLRGRSDAVVTGLGTVVADDPSLNARLPVAQDSDDEAAAHCLHPLRVVLDPQLNMPENAGMARLPGDTLVLCTAAPAERRELLETAGMEVVEIAGSGGRVSLGAVLDHLGGRQINEVLIEAGATLAGAALDQGLIDELVVYIAPHIMGDGARGLFCLPGLERMQDRIGLEILDIRVVGRDIRVTARPGESGLSA
ncbi:MAG: bifunctional diaminohydroxyphosphoribosylaminopyrimidine deaminase/5-amino-6-(5-phosphoribosylamino)uracil reductase RibD [Gammaproteobacteria bacterium]|nr:bifunctional diaminohydroxyphosphoribosylaminopyrimidine deaminase/5-amino-6-(5-phosphoribosylamino)uracil reductase RibD [Gammaproteobacteria bacterium]